MCHNPRQTTASGMPRHKKRRLTFLEDRTPSFPQPYPEQPEPAPRGVWGHSTTWRHRPQGIRDDDFDVRVLFRAGLSRLRRATQTEASRRLRAVSAGSGSGRTDLSADQGGPCPVRILRHDPRVAAIGRRGVLPVFVAVPVDVVRPGAVREGERTAGGRDVRAVALVGLSGPATIRTLSLANRTGSE